MGALKLVCALLIIEHIELVFMDSSTLSSASYNTTTSEITSMANIPVNSSSTSTTPTTTRAAVDVEALISANQVQITFYNVDEDEFQITTLQSFLSGRVTAYCKHNATLQSSCSLVQGQNFVEDNVRVSDLEAIAPNLRMNVAVVFPDSANVTDDSQVLASATLKNIIVEYQRDFKSSVGHDLIGVGSSVYSIAADTTNNAIICAVFASLTVLLFIIVLLIRKTYMDTQEKERNEKLAANLRKKELERKAYKIRPGPDPIVRYHPIKQNTEGKPKKQHRSSLKTESYHLEVLDEQNGTRLPPLDLEAPVVEKKKRKKKRKTRDSQRQSSNSEMNNMAYDDSGEVMARSYMEDNQ